MTIKQEPIEVNEILNEPSSSIEIPIKGFILKLISFRKDILIFFI